MPLAGSKLPASISFIGRIEVVATERMDSSEVFGLARSMRTVWESIATTSFTPPICLPQPRAFCGSVSRFRLPTTSAEVSWRPLENAAFLRSLKT
ncbi:hypothetical protein D3C71_1241750 [compost metagenome]